MLIARYPEAEDLLSMTANIRDIDKLEIKCLSEPGESIINRLQDSVKRSDGVLAIRDTILNTCICIFGFQSVKADSKKRRSKKTRAIIWCIGSKHLPKFGFQFTKYARKFIDAIIETHSSGVYNVIHANNTVSKRWLRACGCRVHLGSPLNFKGEPFTWFEKEGVA